MCFILFMFFFAPHLKMYPMKTFYMPFNILNLFIWRRKPLAKKMLMHLISFRIFFFFK